MIPRTIISAIALSGVALLGCEKEPDNGSVEPEPREAAELEPGLEQPAPVEEQQPTMGEQEQAEPTEELQTLSAVTILGIDVVCPTVDVYFPTDSAELDADDKAMLDLLASCLKGTATQETIEITATADPRGPEPYNEELSRRRAESVAEYLEQQGVSEASFEIRARGEQGVVEGIPALWPLQREAVAKPTT